MDFDWIGPAVLSFFQIIYIVHFLYLKSGVGISAEVAAGAD
jgi:hypothetical protein